MQTKEQKEIMYESNEAATYRTNISGWVSVDGKFFGKSEELARYHSHTHRLCECGTKMASGWSSCDSCRKKKSNERFSALPEKEDWSFPITLWDDDHYFFDMDSVRDYAHERETSPECLMLIDCKPNYLFEVGADYWADVLGEDGNLPKEVEEALANLNEVITKHKKAITWESGNHRIKLKV